MGGLDEFPHREILLRWKWYFDNGSSRRASLECIEDAEEAKEDYAYRASSSRCLTVMRGLLLYLAVVQYHVICMTFRQAASQPAKATGRQTAAGPASVLQELLATIRSAVYNIRCI